MKKIGLYIHVPFCAGKCPYCDFYSVKADESVMHKYTQRVCDEISRWGKQLACEADTLYFGGGTPSVLGAENIGVIIKAAQSAFLSDGAEITLECNPSGLEDSFFSQVRGAGVNRVSLGLQSAVDGERRALGRRADAETAHRAVELAKRAGIDNISLDLMLGIPNQTQETLKESVEFCAAADVRHVSAYMLKLEEGTWFYNNRDKLTLPDEDATCDMYLSACELLEKNGFMQYEISNFSKLGYESRHNLKYWNAEDYLGIGPSAHSMIDGRRFFYERDLNSFLKAELFPQEEGQGGDFEEYAMLRLRLTQGLREEDVEKRFGHAIPTELYERCAPMEQAGYFKKCRNGIAFTPKGFLVSNMLISKLLFG